MARVITEMTARARLPLAKEELRSRPINPLQGPTRGLRWYALLFRNM
jgi:hypothetical protein